MYNQILHHTLCGNFAAKKCLVFVHGYACNEQDWFKQINFFAKDFQILSCDLRGHGQSINLRFNNQFDIVNLACDIKNLIEALAINKPIILIGHSMACRVILELYTQIPQHISNVICIDCGYQTIEISNIQALNKQINQQGFHLWLNGFFSQMFTITSPEIVKKLIMQRLAGFPQEVGLALLPNILIYDYYATSKALGLLKVPALFLQATMKFNGIRQPIDKIDAKSEWLELVTQQVVHAQIQRVTNSGHFIMLEQPEFTNNTIATFLATA